MISIRQQKIRRFRPSTALRHDDEPIVKNGLALTPSAMVEMMNQGMPISAQGYSIKEESLAQSNDFFVPAEHARHFDMVDAWEIVQDVREKTRKARKKVASGELAVESQQTPAVNA